MIFFCNFLKKNLSGIQSEYQTVWIEIRPCVLSDTIWVDQAACKGYKKKTPAGKELGYRGFLLLLLLYRTWTVFIKYKSLSVCETEIEI